MAGDRLERLRVEWAEALPVAAARRHQDHRALPLAVRAPEHARHLGGDLVEGERQEVGELQEGDRAATGQRAADRLADDGRLGQRRVLDPRAELRRQAAGDAEDIAFRILDVLTEKGDARVDAHAPA